jgi:hypothetical protein
MNNTLTNIGTAYGRGYEMGKADAFLGFFTADDTVAEDFITDLAHELRQIKTALHSAIGDHAPRPVGTCPVIHPDTEGECGGKLYQDRYGGMSVTCKTCGMTWHEDDLRRLGLMQTTTP